LLGQCSRDRYTLLLSAGEPVGSIVRVAQETDLLEGLEGNCPIPLCELTQHGAPARRVPQAPAENVFDGTDPSDQLRSLKDQRDERVAAMRWTARGTQKQYVASGGAIQAREHAQERALARSTRTQKGNELPGADLQINAEKAAPVREHARRSPSRQQRGDRSV
jgi:hypothetical protein